MLTASSATDVESNNKVDVLADSPVDFIDDDAGQPTLVKKTIDLLEPILRIAVRICFIWMAIQGLLGLSLAIIIMYFSGEILNSVSDGVFKTDLLSPLIPVWNDIGDALPFRTAMYRPVMTLILLSLGWLIISGLCLLYMVRRRRRELWLLIALTCISLVMFIIQTSVLIGKAQWEKTIMRRSGSTLANLLRVQYEIVTTDAFSTAVNIIMVMGRCCGVYGPNDFAKEYNVSMNKNIYDDKDFYRVEKLPYWPTRPLHSLAKVPPVCCYNDVIYISSERILERLLLCSMGSNPELYIHTGCSDVYYKLWSSHLKPGMAIYFAVSSITIGILIVYCILSIVNLFYNSNEVVGEEEEVEGEDD